jgi:hypothetical protein
MFQKIMAEIVNKARVGETVYIPTDVKRVVRRIHVADRDTHFRTSKKVDIVVSVKQEAKYVWWMRFTYSNVEFVARVHIHGDSFKLISAHVCEPGKTKYVRQLPLFELDEPTRVRHSSVVRK